MSDYITPLNWNLGCVNMMLIHLGIELDLPKLMSHNESWEQGMVVSPPGDPNTVIFNQSSGLRKGTKWKVGAGCLNPDDLAKVEADPAMQRRWVETWQAAAPLLADIERILTTKSHLRESVPLSQALGHLPYDPGFSWDEVSLGSVGILAQMGVLPWIRDWSSVRRRWDEGGFEMLQPRQPAMWHPLNFAVVAMQGVCGKKELELLGATSMAAAGGTTFFAAGGGTSDDDQT
jgi:hypothetical protein